MMPRGYRSGCYGPGNRTPYPLRAKGIIDVDDELEFTIRRKGKVLKVFAEKHEAEAWASERNYYLKGNEKRYEVVPRKKKKPHPIDLNQVK